MRVIELWIWINQVDFYRSAKLGRVHWREFSRCFCSGEDHGQAQTEDFSIGHGFRVGLFGFDELVE